MERTFVVQKLNRKENDAISLAQRYYMVISAVNNIGLTEREVQLVSFIAVKGNIGYSNIKQEFCEKYNSSPPTINNIISKLKKMGILVKNGTKVRVHPMISLDFEKNIPVLQIKLELNDKSE
jgi:hypothetical protein